LRHKLTIVNVDRLLRGYVSRRYWLYDGVRVPQDRHLGVTEIALANMVNSRMSGNTAEEIWCIRHEIGKALADIPTKITTDQPVVRSVLGEKGIERAVAAMCKVRRVKLATATKILHKKRPSIIPILDRVVESYYWKNRERGEYRMEDWGVYAVALIKAFHQDLQSVADQINELRKWTVSNRTPLTECRILEVLMWIQLGGYAKYFLKAGDGRQY
jgi:hypothetical protein